MRLLIWVITHDRTVYETRGLAFKGMIEWQSGLVTYV